MSCDSDGDGIRSRRGALRHRNVDLAWVPGGWLHVSRAEAVLTGKDLQVTAISVFRQTINPKTEPPSPAEVQVVGPACRSVTNTLDACISRNLKRHIYGHAPAITWPACPD